MPLIPLIPHAHAAHLITHTHTAHAHTSHTRGHSAHHATGHAHCALEAVYGAHTGAVCLGAHALESTHHTHGGSETAHGELGKEGRGSGAQSYN